MFRRLLSRARGDKPPVQLGREFHTGDLVEQRFDIEQVRRGFMGVVYIAYDRRRRKRVVIKTFQNKFLWDEAAIGRFNTEAELWRRLGSHPNIVRAYELRTFLGKPHVIAEYVHGGPLRGLVGHLQLHEAIEYALQVCWGMAYAHDRAALLHCDIKPDNIMVTLDGHAKVTDFGLARVLPSWQWSDDQRNQLTWHLPGAALEGPGGTLPYMAPELLERSSNVGTWSDIYAFGVMLFELVTGKLPFDAIRDESLIRMHLHQPPPDPRSLKPQLPPAIADVVLTCLAKKPADRYQSFADVEYDLQRVYKQVFKREFTINWQTGDQAERNYWTERGQAHMDLGESKEALQCFLESIRVDNKYSECWLNLARARLKLWQYGETQQAIDAGLAVANGHNEIGPLYQVRGEMFAAMQRPVEAIAAYNQGLSFTPTAPGLWREKGALLLRMNMAREARNCLEEAARLDPFDAAARRLLGDCEMALGDLRGAYAAYGEALKLDPRSPLGWARYGACQLRQLRPAEALRSFEAALKLDPDLQEALEGVRQARQALGR